MVGSRASDRVIIVTGNGERGRGTVGITFWLLASGICFLIFPDTFFCLDNLLGHLFGNLPVCFLPRNGRNERNERTDEPTVASPNNGRMDECCLDCGFRATYPNSWLSGLPIVVKPKSIQTPRSSRCASRLGDLR